TPELTAFDLIQFEDRVGGLNRVTQILNELVESFDGKRLSNLLVGNTIPITYIQRLGFILQMKLKENKWSDQLLDALDRSKKGFQNIPLKAKGKRSGFPIDSRWKVI